MKLHRYHTLFLTTAIALVSVALACTGTRGGGPTASPSQPQPEATAVSTRPSGTIPPGDITIHSVPLESVVFDTFSGGFIRLSEASGADIKRLEDAIAPIYEPRYDGPEGGMWQRPSDLVLGYVGKAAAYAYPVKMLNFHEIVNDVIDGAPLLITYCPLCASGVVYDRQLDEEVLLFGNTSALYENDLVMYDHQTGSYWFQVGGEAIVGTLTGKRLSPLPSVTMPWDQWLELHPDTRVLSRDQRSGRASSYDRDPFQGYARRVDDLNFPFSVSAEKLDDRLRPSALVLSVQVADEEKAYPLEDLGDAAVNDTVGGKPVVVFSRAQGPTASAFSPQADGRLLTFQLQEGQVRDQETGSRWDFSGRAVEGPLEGQQLEPLPTRRAFWFSLSLALPKIPLFQP